MESTPISQPNKTRPTYLTVLCILTFLCSGYLVLDGIWNYTNIEKAAEEQREVFEKLLDDSPDNTPPTVTRFYESGLAISTVDVTRKSNLSYIFCCLLTLTGAIMMWMQKKTGFYIYVAGSIALAAAQFFILPGKWGIILGGGWAAIGIIFIAMYGANLKHMR